MQISEIKLSKREKVISAIAASISSGCVTCLKYHKEIGLRTGISNDEILEIANIALNIKKNGDKFSRIDIDSILENVQTSRDIDCSDDCSCNQIMDESLTNIDLNTISDDCGCD